MREKERCEERDRERERRASGLWKIVLFYYYFYKKEFKGLLYLKVVQ